MRQNRGEGPSQWPGEAAGKQRIASVVRALAPRWHHAVVEATMAALDEQSVTVPLARAAELVLPQLTTQVTSVLAQREQTTALVEEMLDQGGGLLPRS